MSSALWEMMYNTKKSLEYELEDYDGKKEKEITAYDMLDKVYERFWEILKDHDVNIDKLNLNFPPVLSLIQELGASSLAYHPRIPKNQNIQHNKSDHPN